MKWIIVWIVKIILVLLLLFFIEGKIISIVDVLIH